MKKTTWLSLSSFGIMFAVLSWFQEGGLLPSEMSWNKGILACVLGSALYVFLARTMD